MACSGSGRKGPGVVGAPHGGPMTEVTQHTTRILLVRRPKGAPVPEDFRLDEAPISALQPGEALVRTIWLSLDPYMRGRMNDGPSYAAPVQLGEVMQGECVGQVEASVPTAWQRATSCAGMAAGRAVRATGDQAHPARPERGAAQHRPRRVGHARPDRLCRPADDRQAEDRRDGGDRRRQRRGGCHRRPTRAKGLPGGGRRRRRGQVSLRRGRTGLRRLPRPARTRSSPAG